MEKFIDIIMFRSPVGPDENPTPRYTTGSIVLGAIIRSAVVIVLAYAFREYLPFENAWLLTLFAIWGFALFPAYREYQNFAARTESIQTSTLCGSCRYYEKTGQICTMLDEHVSEYFLPCEGEGWEPRNIDV